MITHLVGSPFSKFESVNAARELVEAPVGVRARRSRRCRRRRRCSAARCSGRSRGCCSTTCRCPACRPGPRHGFEGLIATLMNCSVFRFVSMCVIGVGTRDSIRLQFARLACSEQRPLVGVAPEREVAERPVGADHPAVRALEDLGRVRRVDDDHVLVGVDAVRRPQARERRRDAAEAACPRRPGRTRWRWCPACRRSGR